MAKRTFEQLTEEEREKGFAEQVWPEDFSGGYAGDEEPDPEPETPAAPEVPPSAEVTPEPEVKPEPAQEPEVKPEPAQEPEVKPEPAQPSPDTVPPEQPNHNRAFAAMRKQGRQTQLELDRTRSQFDAAQAKIAEQQRQIKVMQTQNQLRALGAGNVLKDDGSIDNEAIASLEGAAAGQAAIVLAGLGRELEAPQAAATQPAAEQPAAEQPQTGYTPEQLDMSATAVDAVAELAGPLAILQQEATDMTQPAHIRRRASEQLDKLEGVVLELEADATLGGFADAATVENRYREAAKRMGWGVPAAAAPLPQAQPEKPRQGPEAMTGGAGAEQAEAASLDRVVKLMDEGDTNGAWIALEEEGNKVAKDPEALDALLKPLGGLSWDQVKRYAAAAKN